MSFRLALIAVLAFVLVWMSWGCDDSPAPPVLGIHRACYRFGDVPPDCRLGKERLHIEFDMTLGVRAQQQMPGISHHELEDSLSRWLSMGCTRIACISFDDCDGLYDDIESGELVRLARWNMNFNEDHHPFDPDTVDYELHVLVYKDLVENTERDSNFVTGLANRGRAWSDGFAYLFLDPIDYYELKAEKHLDMRKALIHHRLLHELGHHMWLDDYYHGSTLADSHSADPYCVMGQSIRLDNSSGEWKYVYACPANEGTDALATTRFCCEDYHRLAGLVPIWWHAYPDTNTCPADGQAPY